MAKTEHLKSKASETFSLRLTAADHQALLITAEILETTPTDVLRACLKDATGASIGWLRAEWAELRRIDTALGVLNRRLRDRIELTDELHGALVELRAKLDACLAQRSGRGVRLRYAAMAEARRRAL